MLCLTEEGSSVASTMRKLQWRAWRDEKPWCCIRPKETLALQLAQRENPASQLAGGGYSVATGVERRLWRHDQREERLWCHDQ